MNTTILPFELGYCNECKCNNSILLHIIVDNLTNPYLEITGPDDSVITTEIIEIIDGIISYELPFSLYSIKGTTSIRVLADNYESDYITFQIQEDIEETSEITTFIENTTFIIKKIVNKVKYIDLFYPIGTYYETSNLDFNPNNSWGGTWELEEDGTVLVSKSNDSESKFNTNVETVIGEEAVQLSLPNYQNFIWNGNVSNKDNDETLYVDFVTGGWGLGIQYIENKNTPHNNIQPSKIVNRWHRTA